MSILWIFMSSSTSNTKAMENWSKEEFRARPSPPEFLTLPGFVSQIGERTAARLLTRFGVEVGLQTTPPLSSSRKWPRFFRLLDVFTHAEQWRHCQSASISLSSEELEAGTVTKAPTCTPRHDETVCGASLLSSSCTDIDPSCLADGQHVLMFLH